MHERARLGRVGDHRTGIAIAVERERVLTGADVALIDTVRRERSQVLNERAVARAWLRKVRTPLGAASAAVRLRTASDRSRRRRA
jgi:hypothetical protein